MMKYKGYLGQVAYDDEAMLFHGEVVGLKDVITFQGTTAEEIKEAFKESVDDYLVWCNERDEKPEKSYTGEVQLKINPDLHAHLALEAVKLGISLHDLINEKLRR